jgi:hypothetical protein
MIETHRLKRDPMKTNVFAFAALAASLLFATGAKAQPELNPEGSSPLILEYKLKTHAKALGNKLGQIAAANKKCDLEGASAEESDVADTLESHSPGSAVSAMGTAYKEGLKAESPPCDQIELHLNKLLSQAARHKAAIGELNKQMEAMLINKYGAGIN